MTDQRLPLIVVADDEADIRGLLRILLEKEGYRVLEASDGLEALRLLREHGDALSLLILDIMMPNVDGLTAAKAIRETSDVPILFLTARSSDADKTEAYRLGADDYITKPFSLAVLYAKVSALIKRRRGNMRTGDLLTAGEIALRLSTRQVFSSGEEVKLTPKEYALLECLLRHKNLVLSREQLLVKCWGYDYEGEARAVDTHIKRLREKLGESGSLIKTVIKAGYKLEVREYEE